jgi:hypothetical protein
MFGQEIEQQDTKQQEPGHQRIPITPFAKQRNLLVRIPVLLHNGNIYGHSTRLYFFRFEISDATSNPIPNPINNPIVTRLINSPKTNPITIATRIAVSLRFIIRN